MHAQRLHARRTGRLRALSLVSRTCSHSSSRMQPVQALSSLTCPHRVQDLFAQQQGGSLRNSQHTGPSTPSSARAPQGLPLGPQGLPGWEGLLTGRASGQLQAGRGGLPPGMSLEVGQAYTNSRIATGPRSWLGFDTAHVLALMPGRMKRWGACPGWGTGSPRPTAVFIHPLLMHHMEIPNTRTQNQKHCGNKLRARGIMQCSD